MPYMFIKITHNPYMPFNAFYGFKPHKPLKRNFNDYMFTKITHKPYMPFNTFYGFKPHKPLKKLQ